MKIRGTQNLWESGNGENKQKSRKQRKNIAGDSKIILGICLLFIKFVKLEL